MRGSDELQPRRHMDGLGGLMDGLAGLIHGFLSLFLFDLLRRASNHLGKGHIYRDLRSEAVGVACLSKSFLTASEMFIVVVTVPCA